MRRSAPLSRCLLFLVFHADNFTLYGGFFAKGDGNMFQALSTTGIIFAYLGFRQALDYAGESKNPQRDVPLATILSVVITTIIYALLQVAFIGALDWGKAGTKPGDWAGLAVSSWANTPLYSAMIAAAIPAMLTFSYFLLVDAGISPAGTGWIYLGTATRTNYGLSINGYGPRHMQWHNKWGVPWISMIIAFVVGCIFFVPAPSWYTLVGFITSTTVLTYIMGGLGVPIFRKYAPGLRRPFMLKGYHFWAPVGFLAAIMVVYWSGFKTLSSVYAAIFVGLPLFSWWYAVRKGWIKQWHGYALGLVFLGGWVYLNRMGGWVFAPKPPTPGSWPFYVYDIALSAAVLFFCAGLWLLSTKEGRFHVERGMWFIWMMLALFPLSYWGQFGASTPVEVVFPWGTLIAVGVGLVAYYWGVASGFNTEQMKAIVAADERERLAMADAEAPHPEAPPAAA